MDYYYRAFGLIFQSSEALPWLTPEPSADRIDVRVDFNIASLPAGPDPDETVFATLPVDVPASVSRLILWKRASDGRFRFQYRDGTQFIASADGRQIGCTWPKGLTLHDACTYLLGPITGFILRRRGKLCLHASAVSDPKSAFALAAPATFGKSSSAAFFAKKGYAVLTDDILALRETATGFEVLPGWPHLRLWPSSVAALFGRPDALPRLCPASADWDKCYLDLTGPGFYFQTEPMPLKVIYSARFEPASSDVRVEPMGQMASLRQLLANTYSWYTLDGSMRAAELDSLTRLVQQVPVRSLIICDSNPQGLAKQCRAILEDAAGERVENRLGA